MTEVEKYDVQIGVDQQLRAELKVAPQENESDLAIVEHTLPPGKLAAPLHRHTREDEISIIIEGRMGILEDGEVSTVEAECRSLEEESIHRPLVRIACSIEYE